MSEISKIKLPNQTTPYDVKDSNARERIAVLEQTIGSALIFKGAVSSASAITGLADYKVGWCYKASASFEFGTEHVTPGDMLVCVASKDGSFQYSDWTVIEEALEEFVGATSTAAGARGLVPGPTAGQQNAVLFGDGNWIDSIVIDCGTATTNID